MLDTPNACQMTKQLLPPLTMRSGSDYFFPGLMLFFGDFDYVALARCTIVEYRKMTYPRSLPARL